MDCSCWFGWFIFLFKKKKPGQKCDSSLALSFGAWKMQIKKTAVDLSSLIYFPHYSQRFIYLSLDFSPFPEHNGSLMNFRPFCRGNMSLLTEKMWFIGWRQVYTLWLVYRETNLFQVIQQITKLFENLYKYKETFQKHPQSKLHLKSDHQGVIPSFTFIKSSSVMETFYTLCLHTTITRKLPRQEVATSELCPKSPNLAMPAPIMEMAT